MVLGQGERCAVLGRAEKDAGVAREDVSKWYEGREVKCSPNVCYGDRKLVGGKEGRSRRVEGLHKDD